MDRILIVNVNWLGDVLFSTPFIRAIRENFPDAYIACMVAPRCKEILELNPRLNEIIICDEEDSHKGIFGKLKLISYIRSRRFDAAFLLHRSFTRALIVFLAGITQRIGYHTKKRSFLLTKNITPPDEEMHRVDFFLNIAKAIGLRIGRREYEFFVSDQNRKRAGGILENGGIKNQDAVIAINPGGNWGPKRWPPNNFAKLADGLRGRFTAKIVITGAAKDRALAQTIASLMTIRPVILCGETTLKELACVFERAALVIANDSGPMHIAVSVGVNTIALFGPTSPAITGPIGKGCCVVLQEKTDCEIPCYDLSCADYKCMKAITVEAVLEAARKLVYS